MNDNYMVYAHKPIDGKISSPLPHPPPNFFFFFIFLNILMVTDKTIHEGFWNS